MLQCNPAFHARIRYYAVSCQHAELINALPVFDSHSDSPVYHLSHAQCMQSELKFMGSSMFAHLHGYMPQNLPDSNLELVMHQQVFSDSFNYVCVECVRTYMQCRTFCMCVLAIDFL